MILDIIIVLFIVSGAFFGYKKGLVGIAVSLASIILSIVLGFILQAPIANSLYNDTGIGSVIEQTVKNNLEATSNKTGGNENNIYENILNTINGNSQVEHTIDESAKAITMFILKGLSFVLVVFIVFIICYILQMILNLMFNIPVLSSINKLGGIAAGIVKVLLKIYVLLAVISFMAPIPIVEPVIDIINKSFVTKFLYNENFLVYIISATLKI